MKFSLTEWRRNYDLVHELGRTLRDSRPTTDGYGNVFPPKIALRKKAQNALDHNITTLLQRSAAYLDHAGIRMPKPLWYYDKENPETHQSSREFLYGHMLGE